MHYLTIILLAGIFILLIVYRIYLPRIKGAIGESRVARQLNKLQNDEYIVFNDILLRTDSGTSQIDHIVISIFGIFVIESKNYRGWIHGSENSEYWTQTIYRSKTKFRNPIRQNWAHICALKNVLSGFGKVTYHPIVVFAGSAELKNVVSKIPVIYANQLFQTIMANRGIPNLDIEKVKSIANELRDFNIQNKGAKREHVHQVREHASERKRMEKSFVCPRCGGNLVVREGPYGKFYGCSHYPQCRYKRSC
jgi:hypothetical protein